MPAISSSGENQFSCPRCGETLDNQSPIEAAEKNSPTEPALDSAQIEDAAPYDCWELDDRLWQIGQALQVDQSRASCRDETGRHDLSRLDAAHAILGKHRPPPRPISRAGKSTSAAKGNWFITAMIWISLSLGTAALVCGGTLLGWSAVAGRNELWNLGLPFAVGGQIALLLGLVLQLDRVWYANHQTVSKLDEVDEQLNDLRTTASLLGTIHGPSSTAFYTHLAGGANPKLLLSDIKGQLDLLAMKIGEQE